MNSGVDLHIFHVKCIISQHRHEHEPFYDNDSIFRHTCRPEITIPKKFKIFIILKGSVLIAQRRNDQHVHDL